VLPRKRQPFIITSTKCVKQASLRFRQDVSRLGVVFLINTMIFKTRHSGYIN